MLATIMCVYLAVIVVDGQYQNVDINTCRVGLQLSCGEDSERPFVTPDSSHLHEPGKPGKRGPVGPHGPIGPKGLKGEKGEPCNCDDRLSEIQNHLDNLERKFTNYHPDCAQLQFRFPTGHHTTEWIKLTQPIPSIEEITVCAWITPPLNTNVNGALASYATSHNYNHFLLYFGGTFDVHVNGGSTSFSVTLSERTHVCVAVNAIQGRVKFYRDGEYVSSGTIASSYRGRIQKGGSFLIGQEQDSIGGGFVAGEALEGTVENFYLWYRELTDSDIRSVFNGQCSCPSITPDIDLRPDQIQLHGSLTSENIEKCA